MESEEAKTCSKSEELEKPSSYHVDITRRILTFCLYVILSVLMVLALTNMLSNGQQQTAFALEQSIEFTKQNQGREFVKNTKIDALHLEINRAERSAMDLLEHAKVENEALQHVFDMKSMVTAHNLEIRKNHVVFHEIVNFYMLF